MYTLALKKQMYTYNIYINILPPPISWSTRSDNSQILSGNIHSLCKQNKHTQPSQEFVSFKFDLCFKDLCPKDLCFWDI